jgi:hypothetical protein
MAIIAERNLEIEIKDAYEVSPLIPFDALDIPIHEDSSGVSNVVIVDSLIALEALTKIANIVLAIRMSNSQIEITGTHEGQHYRAANMQGVTGETFALKFGKTVENGSEYPAAQPFMRHQNVAYSRLNRLRRMAITAFPLRLSQGDIDDLHAFDYDVDRVGFEAMRSNARWFRAYTPVPLSYVPNTQRHLLPNSRL